MKSVYRVEVVPVLTAVAVWLILAAAAVVWLYPIFLNDMAAALAKVAAAPSHREPSKFFYEDGVRYELVKTDTEGSFYTAVIGFDEQGNPVKEEP